MVLPTTAMFRMPFVEQLGLMRDALQSLQRRIPEVEKNLRQASIGMSLRPWVHPSGMLDTSKFTAEAGFRRRTLTGL
jgi:hypothetical protein